MRFRAVLKRRLMLASATAILGVSTLLLTGGTEALAQAPAADPAAQHAMTDPADQNKELTAQIVELRAQVARLQAAIEQTSPGKKPAAKPGMNNSKPAPAKAMGTMDDKTEMGMPAAKGTSGSAAMPPGGGEMGMKGEMGGMPDGGQSAMSKAPAAAMGMCCMGEMGAMSPPGNVAMSPKPPAAGSMATMSGPSSAMPGQPGASHLYHVGSTGFFLNHSQHITLTADQKVTLNRVKEKAMLDQASEQRRIDQGEQELYSLTGADQLDTSKIEAKVSEIEKLRAQQRMNFIQAVGEASKVLTHEQHQALIGTMAKK